MTPLHIKIQRWLVQPKVWRFVGFASALVGLLCYALSSSFNYLFGDWNLLKIFLYIVFSSILCRLVWFARAWQSSSSHWFEAHMAFLVLTITSIYSFFFDKEVKGKPDAYTLVSWASFAVMSLSLSRQAQFGFEVDLLYFFVGALVVQLMKINLWLAVAGVGFSYALIIFRSYLVIRAKSDELRLQNHHQVTIQIDSHQSNTDSALPIRPQQLHRSAVEIPSLMPVAEECLWSNIATVNVLRCHLNKYLAGKDDQIPVAVLNDHNFLMDELPLQVTSKHQQNMADMIFNGFEKDCLEQYGCWRREFLQLAETELITEEEEVEEKKRIKSWIKLSNISLRILFPNERRVCDHIFSDFSVMADRSFALVCSELTTNLLNFANAFSDGTHSLNRWPDILQVFGSLHDLIPEFESVFSDPCSISFRTEAIAITKRLRETIRGMFVKLEGLIHCDTKQADIPGGICPITVEVMNHLRAFGDEKFSLLSSEVTRIIELLESHLHAKSNTYTNSVSVFVLLMNNERYIQQKAKQYQLGSILGDESIQRRITKASHNIEHYRISSWDEVLEFLKLDSNESVEPNLEAAESMKEKLNLFNIHFKEIWMDQSAWFAGEEDIREELRKSMEKILF